MNKTVLTVRDHYSATGKSYQEIALRDGDNVPPVLREYNNPPQSTTDIPFSRYTDRQFFELEMQKMWRRVWQYACREEHVPEVGDYYVYDIGRYSVIIVRTDQGLRAYHNSCLHRGTKLKPSHSSGWSASIQCPFHGWNWNLDGSSKSIFCEWEFPHLSRDKVALRQARVDSWNGFIFVNISAQGPELIDYLEVLPEHFRNWDLTGWYVYNHVQKRLPANWKLAQESFMEAYHTPFVHPNLSNVVSDVNMQHDIFSAHISRDLSAMASPSPTSTLEQSQQDLLDKMLIGDRSKITAKALVPEGKTARWVMAKQLREQMAQDFGLDYSKRSVPEMIDSLKYNVFPNLFIYASVGLPVIQQFRPDGDDHDWCLFDHMVLRPKPPDGSPYQVAEVIRLDENESYSNATELDPFLASILDQDTNIMRWQREGMYASAKGAETLSIYQESRIRHVHDTLDKYLKI
jgi:phenylpropionate dioxygenase-like ring-hydroxylating dioxygenase large terminal subunit